MLFNSIDFIFIFLPLTFVFFYFSVKYVNVKFGLWILSIASLFFYTYWNPPFLLLLLTSVSVNYLISKILLLNSTLNTGLRKAILYIGVTLNLVTIGFFKYFNFFIENINYFIENDFAFVQIILPLGISFFTFQQIIYIIDSYNRKIYPSSYLEYLLYISFFPQLIAGPIVKPEQMLPQLLNYKLELIHSEKVVNGIVYFLLGLFKKVVLADTLATYIKAPFSAAERGIELSFIESLYAMLGYTFQLYFDFSGYCDMAIGLGFLFGVTLPTNFNSPYKARNIITFWRNWHITLSHFLRDYIYIPLGGNRIGKYRQHINTLITMFIGGLWHGANWTFVIWGLLHGIYLVINHSFILLLKFLKIDYIRNNPIYATLAWIITFSSVAFAWIIFRATTFTGAIGIIKSLFDFSNISLPSQITALLPSFLKEYIIPVGTLTYAGNSTISGLLFETFLIGISFFIVFFMPNIPALSNRQKYILVAITFYLSLQKVLFSFEESEFIYFQF